LWQSNKYKGIGLGWRNISKAEWDSSGGGSTN
jgi:hypothetical protein